MVCEESLFPTLIDGIIQLLCVITGALISLISTWYFEKKRHIESQKRVLKIIKIEAIEAIFPLQLLENALFKINLSLNSKNTEAIEDNFFKEFYHYIEKLPSESVYQNNKELLSDIDSVLLSNIQEFYILLKFLSVNWKNEIISEQDNEFIPASKFNRVFEEVRSILELGKTIRDDISKLL